MTSPFSRGFRGRPRSAAAAGRLPPGQYETRDFPVLSAGPTPRVSLEAWDFTLRGPGGQTARGAWDEFQGRPREPVPADSECVTRGS
jgi:DMSO/TMAO reductase YedYZ molybdopterin-dependent catalytic subunit